MVKFLRKLFRRQASGQYAQKSLSRSELRQKVEQGTDKAVKEYGYVFKKLAEYDRI